jgi:hypothetical protein
VSSWLRNLLLLECVCVYTYNILPLLDRHLNMCSIVWSSITFAVVNKMEGIKQNLSVLCFNRFFSRVLYSYGYVVEQLKLHSLHKRKCHPETLFLIQIYLGSKFCPFLLDCIIFEHPVAFIYTLLNSILQSLMQL